MSEANHHHMLPPQVASQLQKFRSEQQRIVFVSGVFDLLHQEHIQFLRKAKEVGDVLFVAIESDVRVRQLKGEGRPVQSQQQRQQQLDALGFVDLTFILPDDFSSPAQHRQIIAEVRPSFLAVSSHTAHLEKKKAIVEEFGGKLAIVHQHNPDVSTTQLLAEQPQK